MDDNEWIAEAIERRLRRDGDFEWLGWLPSTQGLIDQAEAQRPDVVVLDVDIPGEDTFNAIRTLAARVPTARVMMLSGHIRSDYVDRAVAAGAWGYLSKNEDNSTIINALRQIARGEFVLGPESITECQRTLRMGQ